MTHYHPTIEAFRELAKGPGNLIPVYREVVADLETPVSAYLKIAREPHSFLLESVEGGERLARYSFMGTEPYKVIRCGPGQPDGEVDPLLPVQAELARFEPVHVEGLPRFLGGAVGYLSYETAHYFEPRVPIPPVDPHGLPEAVFMFTHSMLVFDHLKHRIQIVAHAYLGEGANAEDEYSKAVSRIDELADRLREPLVAASTLVEADDAPVSGVVTIEPRSNKTAGEYHQMVNKVKDYVFAGDVIQVVPSQRLEVPVRSASFDIYRSLRAVNPSPYMYFLHLEDFDIVGASPEMLVRLEDGVVDTHPIAGTRRRGVDEGEDKALEAELLADEKERSEHIMLLDLGRNDIGRVSKPGTVRVTQMMEIERYSHVMHLVSHVSGEIRDDLNCYDALRACFPAGTVSGAPKIRAMEIIAELEGERRGSYAGSVAYFSFSGNMDTAIAIRTMVVKGGVAYLQAGGGVVYDSEPEFERLESLQKVGALLRAIEEAERGRV
jgi:anthranilate synthase component 1